MTITVEHAARPHPAQRSGNGHTHRSDVLAALLVLIGLCYRLYLTVNVAPPTNSDEATMGLAALHIAQGRGFPAFFYGQHHMGTLEAYLAAPLFAVFGPSIVALRLPLLAVYAAFCWVMYRLTVRLYGRHYALFVVALLAVGANAVIRGEIFAGGGYPEIKPVGAGLVLLAAWLAQRERGRGRMLGFAAFGFFAGIAAWLDWLILPYVAAAAALLVFGCGRELLRWPGAVLLVASLVGALPSIVHNLHGGSTLADMLQLSRDGHAPAGDRLHGAVLLGVPLATGLCNGGECHGWPLALGAAYPLLLLIASVHAARRLRADADGIGQAGRLALLIGAALTLAAYGRSDAAGLHPTTSVRYLTPLLISLPAVLWPLWSAAARLRLGRWRQRRLAIAGTLLLAVHVSAIAQATVAYVRDVPAARGAAGAERALVDGLTALGITRMYSGYWTCARVVFATHERILCAALSDDLRPGHDRYLPHRDTVNAASSPAYVLPINSPAQRALAQRLRIEGVDAAVADIAGYRVYRPTTRISVPGR